MADVHHVSKEREINNRGFISATRMDVRAWLVGGQCSIVPFKSLSYGFKFGCANYFSVCKMDISMTATFVAQPGRPAGPCMYCLLRVLSASI